MGGRVGDNVSALPQSSTVTQARTSSPSPSSGMNADAVYIMHGWSAQLVNKAAASTSSPFATRGNSANTHSEVVPVTLTLRKVG